MLNFSMFTGGPSAMLWTRRMNLTDGTIMKNESTACRHSDTLSSVQVIFAIFFVCYWAFDYALSNVIGYQKKIQSFHFTQL
jgi:hypothetical protein